MPKIIVYNNDTDRMEVYYRDLSEFAFQPKYEAHSPDISNLG